MKIGELIRRWRMITDQDLRSVAKEIGIGAATLMRIEHGKGCDNGTMLKLIAWLFR